MILDILYVVCNILIDIFNVTLTYTVGFGKTFTRNKFRWFTVIILLFIIHVTAFLLSGKDNSNGIGIITLVLIPLFLQNKFSLQVLALYPFVLIATSEVSVSSTFILSSILNIPYGVSVNNNFFMLACQGIPLIILLIAMLIKKLKNVTDEIYLSKIHYVIIYLYTFSILFLLAPAQLLIQEAESSEMMSIGVTSTLASVLLLILLFWLIYASHREQKLKTQQMLTKQQMDLQKDYYNDLINRDTAIRKFRHDMKAQLLVLRDFCVSGSLDSAAEHIESMIDKSSLFERSSITGNNEVDAILSAAQAQALEKDITFEAKGMIPADMDIATYDLCSLVYNPLKNALEACEKIPDSNKRHISFKASVYNNQLFIQVINSMSEDMIISDGELRTSKDDKLNHGYGLRIVSEIVKKYNGILEMKCEEGMFSLEISI